MNKKTRQDLDRIDFLILQELQRNGRLTMAELAEKVSLSQSPCWRRVQMLEEAGLIRGYQACLDRKLLGLGVHGFISVKMKEHCLKTVEAFESAIIALPQAIACQTLSGSYDYQIELVAEDHERFATLCREIRTFPGVTETYTSFTLHDVKTGGRLPIPG